MLAASRFRVDDGETLEYGDCAEHPVRCHEVIYQPLALQ
jgi:hypothetical protein